MATRVCFAVRSGQGGPDGDGGFTDTVAHAIRIPLWHAGWLSVRWKGSRYALRSNHAGLFFIITRWPIGAGWPAGVRPKARRPRPSPPPPAPDPPRRRVRVVDI